MPSLCIEGDSDKCKKGQLQRELSKLTLCCGQVFIFTALLTLSFWVALRKNMPACYVMEANVTDDAVGFKVEIRNQDLYKKLKVDYLLLRVGKLYGKKNTSLFDAPEKPIVVSRGGSRQLPWDNIVLVNGTRSRFENYTDWNYYLFQIVMRVRFGGVNSRQIQIMQSADVFFDGNKSAIVDKRRGLRFVQGYA